jgi:hypothetical protein
MMKQKYTFRKCVSTNLTSHDPILTSLDFQILYLLMVFQIGDADLLVAVGTEKGVGVVRRGGAEGSFSRTVDSTTTVYVQLVVLQAYRVKARIIRKVPVFAKFFLRTFHFLFIII